MPSAMIDIPEFHRLGTYYLHHPSAIHAYQQPPRHPFSRSPSQCLDSQAACQYHWFEFFPDDVGFPMASVAVTENRLAFTCVGHSAITGGRFISCGMYMVAILSPDYSLSCMLDNFTRIYGSEHFVKHVADRCSAPTGCSE